MIDVRATVKGEPDAPPTTVSVKCNTDYEEEIFMNSVGRAQTKLIRKLRLNVHESLLLYFACIICGLRKNDPLLEIENTACSILSSEFVLIGVQESLQEIVIVAAVDAIPPAIINLKEPIKQYQSKNK